MRIVGGKIWLGSEMDARMAAVCLIYALVNVTYLLMAPFYPQMSENRGLSSLYVGVAFAAMPGAVVLSTPFMPMLLRVLSKRLLVMVGCGVQAVGLVVLGVSEYASEEEFAVMGFVSRAMSGVALAILQVTGEWYTAFALAATEYQGKTKQVISELETFAGLSVALGPVISAPLYHVIGFQAIFYASAAVFIAVSPLALLLPAHTQTSSPEHVTVSLATVLTVRVSAMQPVLLDTLAVVYVMICLGVMEAYVSLRFLSLGVSMPMVGLAMSGQPAAYTLSCLFYSRFLHHFTLKHTITLGLFVGALGTALCAPPEILPQSPWVVWSGVVLIGIGMASSFIPSLPHMIDEANRFGLISSDDSLENVLSSITSGAFSLGEMLGPALAGAVLLSLTFQELVQLLGCSGLFLTLFYFLFTPKPVPPSSIL